VVADVGLFRTEDSASKWVRKPPDCPVPGLASRLAIISTLFIAWKALAVPVDRTPLDAKQSFHLLIGAARVCGRRPGETRCVGRAQAFDKEGEFCGWQSGARV
jgi:hypothetical protein